MLTGTASSRPQQLHREERAVMKPPGGRGLHKLYFVSLLSLSETPRVYSSSLHARYRTVLGRYSREPHRRGSEQRPYRETWIGLERFHC
jgi:hypothetical protein